MRVMTEDEMQKRLQQALKQENLSQLRLPFLSEEQKGNALPSLPIRLKDKPGIKLSRLKNVLTFMIN